MSRHNGERRGNNTRDLEAAQKRRWGNEELRKRDAVDDKFGRARLNMGAILAGENIELCMFADPDGGVPAVLSQIEVDGKLLRDAFDRMVHAHAAAALERHGGFEKLEQAIEHRIKAIADEALATWGAKERVAIAIRAAMDEKIKSQVVADYDVEVEVRLVKKTAP